MVFLRMSTHKESTVSSLMHWWFVDCSNMSIMGAGSVGVYTSSYVVDPCSAVAVANFIYLKFILLWP